MPPRRPTAGLNGTQLGSPLRELEWIGRTVTLIIGSARALPMNLKPILNRALDVVTVCFVGLALYLSLRPGSQLWALWEIRRSNAATLRAATQEWGTLTRLGSPLGSAPRRVDIVEIADYECPFCRLTSSAVDSAVSSGLSVTYVHLPLSFHPQARGAAMASLCAEKLGRFAPMHHRLMTSALWQQDTNWVREAKAAGVTDTIAFSECLVSEYARHRLGVQSAVVERLAISGTPTFLSLHGVHRGTASLQELTALAK